MTIYTAYHHSTAWFADIDTDEEVPSAELFTLVDTIYSGPDYDGMSWGQVAAVEGAAEALVSGDLALASEYLAELDMSLTERA